MADPLEKQQNNPQINSLKDSIRQQWDSKFEDFLPEDQEIFNKLLDNLTEENRLEEVNLMMARLEDDNPKQIENLLFKMADFFTLDQLKKFFTPQESAQMELWQDILETREDYLIKRANRKIQPPKTPSIKPIQRSGIKLDQKTRNIANELHLNMRDNPEVLISINTLLDQGYSFDGITANNADDFFEFHKKDVRKYVARKDGRILNSPTPNAVSSEYNHESSQIHEIRVKAKNNLDSAIDHAFKDPQMQQGIETVKLRLIKKGVIDENTDFKAYLKLQAEKFISSIDSETLQKANKAEPYSEIEYLDGLFENISSSMGSDFIFDNIEDTNSEESDTHPLPPEIEKVLIDMEKMATADLSPKETQDMETAIQTVKTLEEQGASQEEINAVAEKLDEGDDDDL